MLERNQSKLRYKSVLLDSSMVELQVLIFMMSRKLKLQIQTYILQQLLSTQF